MRHAMRRRPDYRHAVAAQAQDRPQIYPTRDVAVTYRVSGQGQGAELTMQWSAAQRLMRMNMPGGVGYMVADHQNQRGFMVMEAMRTIMDVPMQQAAGMQQAMEEANFTRGGTEKIAGTDCTVWRYQGRGQAGEACITGDGVMLRAQGARRASRAAWKPCASPTARRTRRSSSGRRDTRPCRCHRACPAWAARARRRAEGLPTAGMTRHIIAHEPSPAAARPAALLAGPALAQRAPRRPPPPG